MKIKIQPLSVNEAYTGRRFKTEKYKAFKMEALWLLPKMDVPKGKLELYIQVGVSNKGRDLDNCAKIFIDVLQKRYEFNDSQIYHLVMLKRIVPKGEEYISFEIMEYIEK